MINYDEDTEFNDALRKHGIIPAKKERTPTPSPPASPTLQSKLDIKNIDEIDQLLDDVNDDEMERAMLAYRNQRMKEMKKEQGLSKFGSILPISRDEYTREVADASKVDEPGTKEGSGTGVVCFLYKEGMHPPSVRLRSQLETLATRYPRTKFTAIVGDKCIPNYPDRMLPTLILYRGGAIKEQLVAWGAKVEGSLPELEAVLIQDGIIEPTRLSQARPTSSADDDDEDDDPLELKLGSRPGKKQQAKIRSSKKDDSDSDFDL